jgi:DNA-binding MarR family transcriptional regulator
MSEQFRKEFEALKQQSVAQLLFKASRLLNEEAIARIQSRGAPSFRVSYTALFPHISFEGTRATEIAKKVGITKQAVGQMLSDLEDMKVIERIQDPTDKRAHLVRFTAFGRDALLHGMSVLSEIEGELQTSMGEEKMSALRDSLQLIIQLVESNQRTP